MLKKIIYLFIILILINGCAEPIPPEPVTSSEPQCYGVKIGQDCSAIFYYNLNQVNIEIIKNISYSTYQVQDDSKTICTDISNNQSICEPKMITYEYIVKLVNINTSQGEVDCYLINDTQYKSENSHLKITELCDIRQLDGKYKPRSCWDEGINECRIE